MNKKRTLTAGFVTATVLASGVFATTALAAPAWIENANLTDAQKTTLEEARELRMNGDHEGARTLIENSDIDIDALKDARKAHRAEMKEVHKAVRDAVDNNDYAAFQIAVEGTKKAEHIEDEEDFAQLVEAHALKEAGDYEGARAVMEELGFPEKQGKRGHGMGKGFGHRFHSER